MDGSGTPVERARAFVERYAALTGLLSLPSVADVDLVAAALERGEDTDATVRRLLQLRSLRSGPVPHKVSRLHEALTGRAEPCDVRGVAERLVSPGGVPFFLVASRPRAVQIGVPSESIKVFVRRGLPVPTVYVLPPTGVSSYGDIEFPLFWNFFIEAAAQEPGKRVVLVGPAAQLERVRAVFRESMFGPAPADLCVPGDICPAARQAGYSVDFYAEQKALSQRMTTVDDFARFVPLDEEGAAALEDGLEVRLVGDFLLEVYHRPEGGPRQLAGALDLSALPEAEEPEGETAAGAGDEGTAVFCPPSFGVTFIGTSHGFDGHGHTTGFIVWIASRGVLVDPPVGTNDFLLASRIPPALLRDVILTHVHADHDAGLLPFLLRHPHRVALHTFRSVHEAFQRKLTHKVEQPELLYDWQPVLARRPARLHGAVFDFDFSFHALPTLCFTVRFGGRAIAYSADTFYEPGRLAELAAAGVFAPQRLAQLLQFPLRPDIDLLIHEAGVPPIHTPLAALEALPPAVRARLRVVHCSGLPARSPLTVPACGLAHTLVLPLPPLLEGLALSARLAALLLASPLFEGLSGRAATALLQHGRLAAYRRDELVMRRGDVEHDLVSLVVDGLLLVTDDARPGVPIDAGMEAGAPDFPAWPPQPATVEPGEGVRFGRIARLCGARVDLGHALAVLGSGAVAGLSRVLPLPPPRSASVVVCSDVCICLQWGGEEIKEALASSGQLERAVACSQSLLQHQTFLQQALPRSSLLGSLPPNLIELLSGLVESAAAFAPGQTIVREGGQSRGLHVVRSGSCRVLVGTPQGPLLVATVEQGEVFGEMSLFSRTRNASVVAGEHGCEVLSIALFGMSLLMDIPAMRSAVLRRVARNRERLAVTATKLH